MDATSLRLISGLLLFAYTASHFSKSILLNIVSLFFPLHAFEHAATLFLESETDPGETVRAFDRCCFNKRNLKETRLGQEGDLKRNLTIL